ncbi:hypothetical protein HPC70_08955 [Flavobacterium psychrophilum]|nr:hypothetical protein HPC70_08955 [Flavobacterium psychrophilum]
MPAKTAPPDSIPEIIPNSFTPNPKPSFTYIDSIAPKGNSKSIINILVFTQLSRTGDLYTKAMTSMYDFTIEIL